MEPEGSLPHSQVSATCPYTESARSSSHPHITLPEDPSEYYPPIDAWVFQVITFPQVSPPKPCTHLSSPHTRYMPGPSHSSRFNHLNNIGLGVQTIMSSSLCSFLHSPVTSSLLGPSPQHPIPKHPQPTFLPQCERPSSTPVQNNGQNYSSLYLNINQDIPQIKFDYFCLLSHKP